jgi:uncharacterized repeat protein (TIGR01451 family)
VLTNVAGIGTATAEDDTSNNRDTVDVTVRLPDLAISKTVEPAQAIPGELLTYTLTVENQGLGDATGLAIYDEVPADTSYEGCSGGQTCEENGDRVTWDLDLLLPGETIDIIMSVRVAADVVSGTQIVNGIYGVSCNQGISTSGTPLSIGVSQTNHMVYLPIMMRNHSITTRQPAATPTPSPTATPENTATPTPTPTAEPLPNPALPEEGEETYTIYLPVMVHPR